MTCDLREIEELAFQTFVSKSGLAVKCIERLDDRGKFGSKPDFLIVTEDERKIAVEITTAAEWYDEDKIGKNSLTMMQGRLRCEIARRCKELYEKAQSQVSVFIQFVDVPLEIRRYPDLLPSKDTDPGIFDDRFLLEKSDVEPIAEQVFQFVIRHLHEIPDGGFYTAEREQLQKEGVNEKVRSIVITRSEKDTSTFPDQITYALQNTLKGPLKITFLDTLSFAPPSALKEALKTAIERKDTKLPNYRNNAPCDEYWLLIIMNAPMTGTLYDAYPTLTEGESLEEILETTEFQTGFHRVFLLDFMGYELYSLRIKRGK